MEHPPKTYGLVVPNEKYYAPPPEDSPQSYCPPNKSRPPPPLPQRSKQHIHPGSSSDSSSYNDHHQHVPTPSFKASSYISQPMNSDANSSSFESHGSPHSHYGAPPYAGFAQPHPVESQYNDHHQLSNYRLHPATADLPHAGHPQCHSWPALAPMELISNINPTDVLSGRGGATNSHSGNRSFRAMVKQYQAEYLKAKKRDKPSVAANVVWLIRNKGGRFLRRYDFPASPHGEVLYYDIGDRRATEKACQALREGAPKRRKKDSNCLENHKCDLPEAVLTGDLDVMENETPPAQRDNKSGHECTESDAEREHTDIRPSASMMRRAQVDPIRLDELPLRERDIYLSDFIPPKATFQSRGRLSPILQVNDCCVRDEAHPVVGV